MSTGVLFVWMEGFWGLCLVTEVIPLGKRLGKAGGRSEARCQTDAEDVKSSRFGFGRTIHDVMTG